MAVNSLRRRDHFAVLRKSRNVGRSGSVRIVAADIDFAEPHVAFAIGRKVGGAVQRNRIRRRLRAICRELTSDFLPGAYLINVLPGAVDLSYGELKNDVAKALHRTQDRCN